MLTLLLQQLKSGCPPRIHFVRSHRWRFRGSGSDCVVSCETRRMDKDCLERTHWEECREGKRQKEYVNLLSVPLLRFQTRSSEKSEILLRREMVKSLKIIEARWMYMMIAELDFLTFNRGHCIAKKSFFDVTHAHCCGERIVFDPSLQTYVDCVGLVHGDNWRRW